MLGLSTAGSHPSGLTLCLWHPLHEANQGSADLQEDGQPSSRPDSARTYKAGKHCPLPWVEVDDALRIAEQIEQ